jgi:predicted nucleic acid-binding protein
LQDLLALYSDWVVLPFDSEAATQYDRLKKVPGLRNAGTFDLQIAAIALCHGATLPNGESVLLSEDGVFSQIPGLKTENWLLDHPLDEAPYEEVQ